MQFVESDPTVFRANISNHFGSLLNDKNLGINIEVGIYNYSIQDANSRQIIKKWKNIKFAEIYSYLQILKHLQIYLHVKNVNQKNVHIMKCKFEVRMNQRLYLLLV